MEKLAGGKLSSDAKEVESLVLEIYEVLLNQAQLF